MGIRFKKIATSVESLCRGFPSEFATYLNYVRSLRFDDQPNYSYLRGIFRSLFINQGFEYDGEFDWLRKVPNNSSHRENHTSTQDATGVQSGWVGDEPGS